MTMMTGRRLLAGITLSFLMLGVAAPAMGQDRYFGNGPSFGMIRGDDEGGRGGRWTGDRGPRLLPPRAIVGSLYRRGYRDVEIRRVRGPSYIAEATGRRGRVLVV